MTHDPANLHRESGAPRFLFAAAAPIEHAHGLVHSALDTLDALSDPAFDGMDTTAGRALVRQLVVGAIAHLTGVAFALLSPRSFGKGQGKMVDSGTRTMAEVMRHWRALERAAGALQSAPADGPATPAEREALAAIARINASQNDINARVARGHARTVRVRATKRSAK